MKKLLMLLLSLVLVFSLLTGVACTKKNDEESPNNNSTPTTPPEEVFEIVEREDFGTVVASNLSHVTLMDAYFFSQGETQLMVDALEGVLVGDILSSAFEGIIVVGFGSDGNWYITADPHNPTKFNPVTNAIFNYELLSGEALGLSQVELQLYGGQKIINVLGTQFGMINLDQTISQMLPETSSALVERMLAFTVNDLYEISTGDLSSIEEFISQIHPDEIINLVFDVATIAGISLTEVQALMVALIDLEEGYLVVNEEVTVAEIVDAVEEVFSYFVSDESIVNALYQIEELLGADVAIGDLATELEDLTFAEIIDTFANICVEFFPENEELIDEIFEGFKAHLQGTIKNPTFNESSISVWIEGIITSLEVDYPAIAEVLEVVGELFIDCAIETLPQDVMEIVFEDLVFAIGDIACIFAPDYQTVIADAEDLLTLIFGGTLGNLSISADALVADVLDVVNDLISNFVVSDIIDVALTEIGYLYEVATLYTFVDDTMNLLVDDVIDVVGNIVVTAIPEEVELVEGVKEILKSVFDGTIANLMINEEYLETNGSKTIAQLIGSSVEGIESEFLQMTLVELCAEITALVSQDGNSELVQMTLAEIDEMIFEGELEYLLTEIGLEGMLQLSISDAISLLIGEPSAGALAVLDSVNFLDFLAKYSAFFGGYAM